MPPSGSVTAVTSARRATRRAKTTIAVTEPTTTPIARLWVATTQTTVTTMTVISPAGIRRSVFGATECQSNVANDTMIITATRAAIGMSETTGPKTMHSTIRNAPARKVDSRVRAPDTRTLIIVWPIIAQPPMPPKKPVTMLATPWPSDSRVLEERVSVMSSTSLAVISDSISPTRAMASAYGATVVSVSRVNGTSGSPGTGSEDGRSPLSPTVGTAMPAPTVTTVRITMDTSGAGTTVVTFGKRTISASPAASSG